MYRQGLGDCFLLTFWEHEGAEPKHVMVDCGVLVGTSGGAEKIREVVTHVIQETGHLEALVATHEHWDHVSGFAQARALFDELVVDEVWMGWTEDPEDAQACSLREDRALRLAGLRAALASWSALPAGSRGAPGDPLDVTRTALSFFGDLPAAAADALAAAGQSTQDAWRYLVEERACRRRRFLEPGDSFSLRGVKGLRVFVLGPPRDERLLARDRPSTTQPETYHLGGHGLTTCDSLLAAARRLARAADGASGPGVGDPFDELYRIPLPEAERDSRFFARRYFAEDESWRRIDGDWLEPLGDLALDLDSDTNNTSLVLAFELGDGGDVILMAADAQVGNWLSWADVEFRYRVGGERRRVTAHELLSRVVLYKVGHHASHNATLRDGGLESMVHDGLVAMIPVDAAMAEKKRWNMPFPPLLERLAEKTRGRILRIDEGLPDEAALGRLGHDEREAFRAAARQEDLFVELVLDTASSA
jgi:hypothetical protein